MNTMKTTFLMALLMVLAVGIGYALGGNGGMMIAFVFALGMNFFSYWFSDKIVLKMYKAQEVTEAQQPRLHNMVRELAQRAQLPMPKVYIIPNPTPNAFATGRNPEHAAVAVTQGIMNLLTDNELRGVLGHELAHVKHRDILIGTIAAVFAGAISMLAHMAQWAMIFGGGRSSDDERGGGLGILVMAIVAPIAAMMIQMAISRSREYLADAGGAKFHGNPHDLASALRKLHTASQKIPMNASPATAHMFIVNPLFGRGGITSLFSTHPPMEERIKRLEALRFA
ncbi:MAG: zinc metalloprotease HtpX [Candidatus Zixiibacteriota bacterium]